MDSCRHSSSWNLGSGRAALHPRACTSLSPSAYIGYWNAEVLGSTCTALARIFSVPWRLSMPTTLPSILIGMTSPSSGRRWRSTGWPLGSGSIGISPRSSRPRSEVAPPWPLTQCTPGRFIAAIGMWPTGLLPEGPACTVCVRGVSVEQPAIPTISLADWAPLNIPVSAANTVDRARKGSGLVHRAELWDRLAQGPSRILDNIAKASQLTMFGRAASTAAYAYQKSLYHGQMLQVDQGTLARWEQQATNVINGSRPRQQGPRTTFAACGHDTLVGTMKAGGFGLLPLRPHVRARQASFACDLIAHDTEWSQIYHAGPDQLGYFQFSPYHKLMLCCPPGARLWQDTEFPNLTFALDALHSAEARVTVLPNASSLEPGEGCAGIPFWHNPPL